MAKIVLASASASRGEILKNAGVAFTVKPAGIDERAVEAPIAAAGGQPADIAMALAEAKALALGDDYSQPLVIGADQVLAIADERWNKPADLGEAREQLLTLSGRTHELHSAVAVANRNAVVWRHCETARMTLRPLTPAIVDAYLGEIGERALSSVGAYQIEGPGIRLFERIDGDFFAILGLPIIPLLAFLRGKGVLE